jgi:RNA polymerase sigma factor (sigma-70 family)
MSAPAGSETPNAALLARACAGDAAGLAELLQRCRPELLTRIRLMMGAEARRRADSGDFLQSALLEVVEDLDRYDLRDERDFLRWATRIARNNIRDEIRRPREQMLESFVSESGLFARGRGAGSDSDAAPVRRAARSEEVELLIEALARLREGDQQAVELRWFEGLSFAEIGRRTGRSEGTARRFHARALIRLGDELKRLGAE